MTALTLEEIARQAGVSRSTVSRVVNQHPSVSPEVRARVMQVIEATGYQPNLAARSLASQRTRIIGLLIPRRIDSIFGDPFFPGLTMGIAQACNHFDYTVSLFLTDTLEDERKLLPRLSQPGMVDGVIVQSTYEQDPAIPALQGGQVPFIVVGRPFAGLYTAFVDVDNVAGARLAVDHLASLGYRRIATITGALNTQAARHRLQGYRQALAEHGLAAAEDWVQEGDFSEAGGYQATVRLLALPAQERPQAIFAASDAMALGALRACQAAGLAVPEQLALVGFDDLPPAASSRPALTTIRQPIQVLGYRAVELLVGMLETSGEDLPQHVLQPELVVRQSCGAPPGMLSGAAVEK
ncbi:MAG: LacI family DNA-binding transcriptional regulator [Anaerolineales bacterium]|nr:LacI family DNA-binding transcriptional regulator [Anaerolineales bacterium]